MQWYYATNGQQNGPVDESALFQLAREGKLRPDDLVWNVNMGNQWAKASTVSGLFAAPDGGGAQISAAPTPQAAGAAAGSHPSATPNRDLMAQARQRLSGNWGLAIGVVVVGGLISFVASVLPLVGWAVNMAISGPLTLGLAAFFLAVARSDSPSFGLLFEGFKRFGTGLLAYLLVSIFTLLWCLLLIIPGIIASLSYSMTFFVLRDNPDLGAMEAIDLSKQMMKGSKWKYFCLQWRFLGWALLCLPTLGIGFLWLWPYIMTSNARFYEDLRGSQQG